MNNVQPTTNNFKDAGMGKQNEQRSTNNEQRTQPPTFSAKKFTFVIQ